MDSVRNEHPSAESCYQRGEILRQQSRYVDAAALFQQALAADPHHVRSLAMLALCWLHDESRKEQAVAAARQAVSLEPEMPFFRCVLALSLANTVKEGQTAKLHLALDEARQAVHLDPDDDFSHSVEAQILLRLRNYAGAEAAAKKALQLNTENTGAAEVLSIALLQQRKDEDNSDLIRYQLERNPEEDSSHTSAGWLALRTGKHVEANRHFLEALRLNPMNEGARLGLTESYRARSFIYRGYLKFVHFMSQFTEGRQQAIMIGGFFAYRLLHAALKNVSPLLASFLVGTWLVFALWSHLARGCGGFFMLFDSYARRSLRTKEKWEGLAVGGMVMLALVVLCWSFFSGAIRDTMAAMALFFAAVVNAAAFTNDHYFGKWIYGSAAAAASGSALFCLSVVSLRYVLSWRAIDSLLPAFDQGMIIAILLGVAVSWLRPLRVGYA